jgi:hypothetical protein
MKKIQQETPTESEFANPYFKNTKLPALYKPPVAKGQFKYDTTSQISGSTNTTNTMDQHRNSLKNQNKGMMKHNQFFPNDLLQDADSAKEKKKRTNTTGGGSKIEYLNHSKSVADDYRTKVPYSPQFKKEKTHNYLLPYLTSL